MRTRTQTSDIVIPASYYLYGGCDTGPTGFNTGTSVTDVPGHRYATPRLVLQSDVDQIADETPRMQRYGSCLHTRTRTYLYGQGAEEFLPKYANNESWNLISTAYVWRKYTMLAAIAGTPEKLNGWLNPVVNLKPVDWHGMSFEALQTMWPSVSQGLQIGNDLLELRQIAKLARPFSWGKSGLVPERYQAAANAHLWWNFGARPLLTTLDQLTRLLKELKKSIARLKSYGSRPQTRHYNRVLDLGTLPLPVETLHYNDYSASPLYYVRDVIWTSQPRYHASMRYTVDVSHLDTIEGERRALLDALGVRNAAALVYNAVPFSFVVDWFVNVGTWAESLMPKLIPIVVQDFCHSAKYEYRSRVTAVRRGTVKLSNELCYRDTRRYERRREAPASYWRPLLQPISDLPIYTAAALLTQFAAKVR